MREEGILTQVETATKRLSKVPCRIYWMTANASTIGTAGTIDLYDGSSTADQKVFSMVTGYDRFNQFIPPIICTKGLYATISGITSYVIGFEAEGVAEKIK